MTPEVGRFSSINPPHVLTTDPNPSSGRHLSLLLLIFSSTLSFPFVAVHPPTPFILICLPLPFTLPLSFLLLWLVWCGLCFHPLNSNIRTDACFHPSAADTAVQKLMNNLWTIPQPLSLLWLSRLLGIPHLERRWKRRSCMCVGVRWRVCDIRSAEEGKKDRREHH